MKRRRRSIEIVETSKEERRLQDEAKWLRTRGKRMRGMKPRLGLESDAVAKKFM